MIIWYTQGLVFGLSQRIFKLKTFLGLENNSMDYNHYIYEKRKLFVGDKRRGLRRLQIADSIAMRNFAKYPVIFVNFDQNIEFTALKTMKKIIS